MYLHMLYMFSSIPHHIALTLPKAVPVLGARTNVLPVSDPSAACGWGRPIVTEDPPWFVMVYFIVITRMVTRKMSLWENRNFQLENPHVESEKTFT